MQAKERWARTSGMWLAWPGLAVQRALSEALQRLRASRLGCALGMSCLGRFCFDERGAELVEWALVTLLVAIASLAALVAVRDGLNETISRVLGGFLSR